MSDTAPVDHDVLDDMKRRLVGSDRLASVEGEPAAYPTRLVAQFDSHFYPAGVEGVSLEIVWRENGDFSLHYREQYRDGDAWECRWDRHPNSHNARSHYHPGPDAARDAAVDRSYPDDWRDVLSNVLDETDTRMRAFWE